jgi:hypothetical protein
MLKILSFMIPAENHPDLLARIVLLCFFPITDGSFHGYGFEM